MRGEGGSRGLHVRRPCRGAKICDTLTMWIDGGLQVAQAGPSPSPSVRERGRREEGYVTVDGYAVHLARAETRYLPAPPSGSIVRSPVLYYTHVCHLGLVPSSNMASPSRIKDRNSSLASCLQTWAVLVVTAALFFFQVTTAGSCTANQRRAWQVGFFFFDSFTSVLFSPPLSAPPPLNPPPPQKGQKQQRD